MKPRQTRTSFFFGERECTVTFLDKNNEVAVSMFPREAIAEAFESSEEFVAMTLFELTGGFSVEIPETKEMRA